MKVYKKYKINNTFFAAIKVMQDRATDEEVSKYWQKSYMFVVSLEERDEKQLSIAQRNWLTNIKQELRKKGMLI